MAGDAGGLSADVLTGEGEEAEGEDEECACAPMRRVCAVRNSISAVATRFCDTVLTRAVMKEKLLFEKNPGNGGKGKWRGERRRSF